MRPDRIKPGFSLRTYRDLKKFVGELTAVVAGNEIALRATADQIRADATVDGWAQLGLRYTIKVDGLKNETLFLGTSRLHAVSLYSGWDGFNRELRQEYKELFAENWKREDGDTPFDEIYRHCPPRAELKRKIGPAREQTIEYYRKVRNAIAHPDPSATEAVAKHYEQHEANLAETRQMYGMLTPPNKQNELSFHDVKLLAKLFLDVAALVSEAFDPGDERLSTLVPLQNWKGIKSNHLAFRKRVEGYLRTAFGLSEARVETIANIILAP